MSHECPPGECYCPDGSEPRWCGHGPGGTCDAGHCLDCDACCCGEEDSVFLAYTDAGVEDYYGRDLDW